MKLENFDKASTLITKIGNTKDKIEEIKSIIKHPTHYSFEFACDGKRIYIYTEDRDKYVKEVAERYLLELEARLNEYLAQMSEL